ncbi:CPBP family intramembrane glutamic endopeptidase [Methylobacter sp. YRD-M1]|uniref:CPBP family intramembrane glutamic endopeptidase n=1 Tax=Methylobacter sp. YRD-M1 TaxID=2911520 RepID=UPI00227C0BB5|nr:CPBP family intramembrane glutamic endopeptidase [Methylobacter sp. YRD-M1]WAK02010.1 CPBP family intramembrane metalloprotease [Methylobacter sp. YRD-M1]
MIKSVYYALVPLIVLLGAIFLACLAGYLIVLGIGDQFPFGKIIKKAAQLFLVLSIFPAMVYFKFKKSDIGFAGKAVFFKQLLQGFGLGFVTLMPVVIVLYGLGVNVIDESQVWTASVLAKKMALSLLLALIISWIEEPLFRGILLTGLKRKISVIAAILISAIYYAMLHFIDSDTSITYQELTLASGFRLLGEAFANLLNPDILSALWALVMVGIFLGILRTEFKTSLGLCIGCHTSWVWQIKMSKSLFNTNFSSEYLYLVNRYYDGLIGPLVTGWLGLAIVGYLVYRRINKPTFINL